MRSVCLKGAPIQIPTLLRLLFGRSAAAVHAVTPRLDLWARAFDAWLESVSPNPKNHNRRQALRAWTLLLHSQRCPPWDLDRYAIETWKTNLAESGFSANTLRAYQGRISAYYRFCAGWPACQAGEPLFDPTCKPFNPVRGVLSLPERNYSKAYILPVHEARTLLRAVDRQTSLIGKRDYALLMTALLTGLPEDPLRHLQWRQLRPPKQEATVTALISLEGEPAIRLHPEAWHAILDYLAASGRRGCLQPEDYIFAPVADPLVRPPTGKGDEWRGDKAISHEQILIMLKAYAGWAGLDGKQVTYACLRHTAANLHLEGGADAAGVQSLLGRKYIQETRVYIGHIGRMLAARKPRPRRLTALTSPNRGPFRRRAPRVHPGNQFAIKHGFYTRRRPKVTHQDRRDSAAAGLENEIAALRVMLGRALALTKDVDDLADILRALNLFSFHTERLAKLIRQKEEAEVADFYRKIDEE